ncbi:MAG: hypothetical protein FE834_04540 [Gammaproteobacteria bacterium]|nr:hypothetical protein [Gammaproteobacteria bacterium]
MNSIFFIESPFQLINASEAIHFFQIKNYKIIIRLSEVVNSDKQIFNLIDILNIDKEKIELIKIKAHNKNIGDYVAIAVNLIKCLPYIGVDKIFIGNLESGFLSLVIKIFSRKKILLLDDGALTIEIQNNPNKFNQNNFYNLFTMYDFLAFKNQKIYKNNFESIRQNINNLKINKSSVLFLGSPFSEDGYMSKKCYYEQINKISSKYSNKTMIYVPHRRETDEDTREIKGIKNIVVHKLDYPVELIGLHENEIPYKVISFYSTALLTMKNIYKIEADSYHANFDGSVQKKNEAIEKFKLTYKHYQSNIGVKFLD